MDERDSSSNDVTIKTLFPSIDEFIDIRNFIFESAQNSNGCSVIKIVPPKEWVASFNNDGKEEPEGLSSLPDFGFQFKQYNIEDVGSGDKEVFKFNKDKNIKRDVIENIGMLELYSRCAGANTVATLEDDGNNSFWNGLHSGALSYCGAYDLDYEDVETMPPDFSIGNLTKSIFGDKENINNSSNGKGKEILIGSKNTCKIIHNQKNAEKCIVSYIHKGSSKHWYIVDGPSRENYMNLIGIHLDDPADEIIVKPSGLIKHSIAFTDFTQKENEFIVILPDVTASYVIDDGDNLSELLDVTCIMNPITTEASQQALQNQQNIDGIKAKHFGELLNHSSNELLQLEEKNASTNSLLNFPNYNLVQTGSLRMGNGTPSQASNNVSTVTSSNNMNKLFSENNTRSNASIGKQIDNHSSQNQQHHNKSINNSITQPTTISRISSPLLSRMMDLSSIVEPTLEDPTLRFKRKMVNMTPANGSSTPISNQVLKTKATKLQNNSTSKGNTANGAMPQNTALEDEEDNMLAISLALMANSRAASPRLTLPPISSNMESNAMLVNMNNNSFISNDNSPVIPSSSLAIDTSLGKNNVDNSSIISPKPLYSSNTIVSQSIESNGANFNNKNMQPIPSSPSSSKLSFMKRLKSPNIVTLNISRENSRSPVSLVGDYRSPLGAINPITYSGTNSVTSLSQLHQLEFSANNNKINASIINQNEGTIGTPTGLSNVLASVGSSNPSPHSSKRQKIEKGTASYSNEMKKKNTAGSIPQNKFGSDEIVISENGKVYICQDCKRQFSSGHHLTRHKKSVHSGEKPHSCPKCGKRFKRRDHVLQHLNKKIPCTQDGGVNVENPNKPSKPKSTAVKEQFEDMNLSSDIITSAAVSNIQNQPLQQNQIPTGVFVPISNATTPEIPVVPKTESQTM
ncbi:hypothetical protein TPHA_0A01940 [Tetrapisispora phaffii CBS 4417]|uniref:C2H2-type domain-containing protein n=1 Tax=Tetrapisispora phaffii (strain ATCC 24235 / CBS 4417 / NBRC 1672 / NRRL Y-8282 / UCD 70-5) TaxID=1071381 RepID=G8BMZ9_TETPH|nr:hypothetical protein TPHA_0A01940 [Tetrapisispora phaffii CBS 4417]CCE61277.1 hypothetical protein TPHA_0A01940 [Tetrapisispora phaffii CBS 4417]